MFIEHCLQRLPPNVNTIPSTNFSQENGIMKVESVDSNNTYIIEVSTEPKCSCKDWFNTHLPCKHLLGMFIAVEGFSWDDMPKNYTTCPHFNLDPHLKQQAMASVKQSSSTNHFDNLSQCNLECVVDPEEKMEVESLINKPNDGRAIGSGNNLKKSLAVLKDIQNSLFLIRNHTDLSDIYTQLQAIQSHINSKIPCEAGLPTLTTTKPTKRAKTFINLPQRKKFIPTKKATEKPLNIPKDVIVEGTFDLPIDLCREENESLLENLEPSSLTDSERVVNTIWNSGTSGSKDYLLSKVGPFNIMDTSILFLKSLLPDEIIDAYIYLLTATRQDKKVFHIPSACASAIVLGQHDLHGYLVDVCRLKLTHIHFVRSNLRIVSSSK
ncbi:Hypothetical predicted protein [Mytilus galloprovincialis]|nr:Hypothetical predicted protein [Mytilus galloprovincialis]